MTFEFDGEKYAKAATHQREWGSRLIAELQLTGDERILDLGCGDGAVTAQLAETVSHGSVIGIDSSRGMILAAQKYESENLTFQLADINELKLPDRFDVIFSNAALHWILDHRRLLRNVYEHLKPDGVLRFNYAAKGNCVACFQVIREAMLSAKFRPYFNDFIWPWYMPSEEEYKTLLADVPFSEAKVWCEDADQYFSDAEALARWIDQPVIVPFLERVGEADKAAFRQKVVEGMMRATRQPDGRFFEAFRRVNVFARR